MVEGTEKAVAGTRKASTKGTTAAKTTRAAKSVKSKAIEGEKVAKGTVVPKKSRILQEVAATGTLKSVKEGQTSNPISRPTPTPSATQTMSSSSISPPKPTKPTTPRATTIPLPTAPKPAPTPLPYRASQPPPPSATSPTAPPKPKFQMVGVEPDLPPPIIGAAKARPISPYDGEKLPPKYRKVAWRVTAIIVGLPVIFVTSYELWRRFSKDGWIPKRKYGDFQTQHQPLTAGAQGQQATVEGSAKPA